QGERRDPHRYVGLRKTQDGADLPPLAHVVRDDEEHRRQRRSGTNRASGAAASKIVSSVSACTMPATGVPAPERILVAVRAIAPVAGIPPSSGDAIFATPCATNSTFELW